MDMSSAVRLAACSRDLHAAIVEARPEIFKTPCLLLSDVAGWRAHHYAHHDTVAHIMPLDFDPTTITQNFLSGMYWVGMNSHWMAAVGEYRNKWVLVNVHTSYEIILPPLDHIGICHRGPLPIDYHVSWTDLVLLKVVICQVPTAYGNYTDFKLIALFDRGVAYLCGGADCRWTLLPSKSCIDGDPQFCDAIEHNGIIYAIDNADGTTYCWDASCKLFSSDFNDNAMTLFELL
jgi:hypothetical protein